MKFFTDFCNLEQLVRDQVIELDTDFFPTPWKIQQWEQLFSAPATDYAIAVERDGELVIGFALFKIIECESLGHLLKIVMKPDRRGEGLGQKLLKSALDSLMKNRICSCFLEVELTNTVAREVYALCGFNELVTLKNFYGAGRHAITMRRN